ncbi:MAG: MazG family protein [Deltaproteobacteria bacterium]|nr:MazG family protein [Deltaproteobacteria bacterium]
MTEAIELESLQELIEIMALLRSPCGCSWDRQQTPETLRKHILEEAYELLEAIDNGKPDEICDELGDLLLQVVFQAQIFSETGEFTLHDVARSICNKLKRRHPHIFSDADHEGHEQRWEEIKRQERLERGQSSDLAHRIPQTLPALKRATKVAKKSLSDDPRASIQKIESRLQQIKEMLSEDNRPQPELEENLGQMLLAICQLSAASHCDPEDILRKKTSQLIAKIDSTNNVY